MNAEIIFSKCIWKKCDYNAVHVSYVCVQISNIYQQNNYFSKWTDVEQNKTSKLFIYILFIISLVYFSYFMCKFH